MDKDLTHWGRAAWRTAGKLLRTPFGGVQPLPPAAAGAARVDLPPPRAGGPALMQALSDRRSTRAFTPGRLTPELLSGLLWAAGGVNRPAGGRTAPSALAMYAVDIYAALPEGLYRYVPATHRLQRVRAADLRPLTGLQAFVDEAALDLVYVEDHAREHLAGPATAERYAHVEAGAMAQNVALFCAAQGLGSVVRALVDRAPLAAAMGLRPAQQVLFAQSVGFPAGG